MNDHPQSISTSLPWLQVDAPNEITFNLDGEPLRGRQFHITGIPATVSPAGVSGAAKRRPRALS